MLASLTQCKISMINKCKQDLNATISACLFYACQEEGWFFADSEGDICGCQWSKNQGNNPVQKSLMVEIRDGY